MGLMADTLTALGLYLGVLALGATAFVNLF
jgi:hypothetical protein